MMKFRINLLQELSHDREGNTKYIDIRITTVPSIFLVRIPVTTASMMLDFGQGRSMVPALPPVVAQIRRRRRYSSRDTRTQYAVVELGRFHLAGPARDENVKRRGPHFWIRPKLTAAER
jgi:hypothetical protein